MILLVYGTQRRGSIFSFLEHECFMTKKKNFNSSLINGVVFSYPKHSVLEQILIEGSYVDQVLPQHERLYPHRCNTFKN